MLHRLTRVYLAAVAIAIIFISTCLLLKSTSETDSNLSAAASRWKDWAWPTYSGDDVSSQPALPGDSKLPTDDAISLPGSHKGSDSPKHGEAVAIDIVSEEEEKQQQQEKQHEHEEPHTTIPTAFTTIPVEPTATAPHATAASSAAKEATATLDPQTSTFTVSDDIVYDPLGPKPSEVVILTATDGHGHNGGIKKILEATAENRQAYCKHQGYNYHFINITKYDLKGAAPVWAKLPAIIETFQTYPDAQWVWWLDLDAIIMTPSRSLNDVVLSREAMHAALMNNTELVFDNRQKTGVFSPAAPDFKNIDFLVSQDHNGINAGSFMIRRSKFSQWMLDMWQDPLYVNNKDFGFKEQDALSHLITKHPVIREHMGLVRQRILNAYPVGGKDMEWKEGDLVVHMAGCWVENKCNERWQQFWAKKEVV